MTNKNFTRFSPPETSEFREIRSLCPLNQKVVAVFWHDDGSVSRSSQLALALYDVVTETLSGRKEINRERGLVAFLESVDPFGYFSDEASNFLGYEYDGKEGDWTEYIENKKRCEPEDTARAVHERNIREVFRRIKDPGVRSSLREAVGKLEGQVLVIRTRVAHEHLVASIPVITAAAETVFGKGIGVRVERFR